jgi:hypothetical protein
MEFVIIWFLCGLIAAVIGARKGEGCAAFIVGFIFGPFGILFALISKGNRIKCPHCKELINKDAEICMHCHSPLNQSSQAIQKANLIISSQATVQQRPQEPKYFCFIDDEVKGPFDIRILRHLKVSGQIHDETPCCLEGEGVWHTVKDYKC